MQPNGKPDYLIILKDSNNHLQLIQPHNNLLNSKFIPLLNLKSDSQLDSKFERRTVAFVSTINVI